MTRAELDRLARGCQLRRLAVNEMVFRVGEPCRVLHVALEGQIKLFAGSSSGQEKVIELIGPGHSFAEAMMFSERPYCFNAQALAPTLLLTVPKANVLAGISRDCRFAMRMLAGLSSRLQGLLQDVAAYALHSGPQRVIGYLLRDHDGAAHPDPITVPLPVSKATIASRLNLTPEYFSRVLHELQAAELIEVGRNEVRIRDAGLLSRAARAPSARPGGRVRPARSPLPARWSARAARRATHLLPARAAASSRARARRARG
ncbi:MAG: Crp/Fnr family transcriptional regulator [Burkholderiaceae bacterium]|nr:MAG: Crp/Fnr family transcriptional regulator [Burkholderiaceae bacterium]